MSSTRLVVPAAVPRNRSRVLAADSPMPPDRTSLPPAVCTMVCVFPVPPPKMIDALIVFVPLVFKAVMALPPEVTALPVLVSVSANGLVAVSKVPLLPAAENESESGPMALRAEN